MEWQRTTTRFFAYRLLNSIRSYCDNKLVKVIVGQRRSGKSYILRQIANDLITNGVHPHNIFYLNKEYLDFDLVNHYTDLERLIKHYQLTLKPQGKIYLFLDEIQNIAQWERLVNSYSQDFTQSYEVRPLQEKVISISFDFSMIF